MALSPEDIALGGIVARYAVENECPKDRSFKDRFLGRRLCWTVYRVVGSATTEETRADVGSFASEDDAERYAERQSKKDREMGARYSSASSVFEPDEETEETVSESEESPAEVIADVAAEALETGSTETEAPLEETPEYKAAIADAAARGDLADSESHQPNAPNPDDEPSPIRRLIDSIKRKK